MIKKNTGYAALFFAVFNISLGVFYAVLHWVWILAWFIFLIANIIIYIGIETKTYMDYSKSISDNCQVINNNNNSNAYDDDNINLNESRTNLSLKSNLNESAYSFQQKHVRESSFTTINSFTHSAKLNNLNSQSKINSYSNHSRELSNSILNSPPIRLENSFDQLAYEKNLKNEKRILDKINQRNQNLAKKGLNFIKKYFKKNKRIIL
jgi:hypothetical protein